MLKVLVLVCLFILVSGQQVQNSKKLGLNDNTKQNVDGNVEQDNLLKLIEKLKLKTRDGQKIDFKEICSNRRAMGAKGEENDNDWVYPQPLIWRSVLPIEKNNSNQILRETTPEPPQTTQKPQPQHRSQPDTFIQPSIRPQPPFSSYSSYPQSPMFPSLSSYQPQEHREYEQPPSQPPSLLEFFNPQPHDRLPYPPNYTPDYYHNQHQPNDFSGSYQKPMKMLNDPFQRHPSMYDHEEVGRDAKNLIDYLSTHLENKPAVLSYEKPNHEIDFMDETTLRYRPIPEIFDNHTVHIEKNCAFDKETETDKQKGHHHRNNFFDSRRSMSGGDESNGNSFKQPLNAKNTEQKYLNEHENKVNLEPANSKAVIKKDETSKETPQDNDIERRSNFEYREIELPMRSNQLEPTQGAGITPWSRSKLVMMQSSRICYACSTISDLSCWMPNRRTTVKYCHHGHNSCVTKTYRSNVDGDMIVVRDCSSSCEPGPPVLDTRHESCSICNDDLCNNNPVENSANICSTFNVTLIMLLFGLLKFTF